MCVPRTGDMKYICVIQRCNFPPTPSSIFSFAISSLNAFVSELTKPSHLRLWNCATSVIIGWWLVGWDFFVNAVSQDLQKKWISNFAWEEHVVVGGRCTSNISYFFGIFPRKTRNIRLRLFDKPVSPGSTRPKFQTLHMWTHVEEGRCPSIFLIFCIFSRKYEKFNVWIDTNSQVLSVTTRQLTAEIELQWRLQIY